MNMMCRIAVLVALLPEALLVRISEDVAVGQLLEAESGQTVKDATAKEAVEVADGRWWWSSRSDDDSVCPQPCTHCSRRSQKQNRTAFTCYLKREHRDDPPQSQGSSVFRCEKPRRRVLRFWMYWTRCSEHVRVPKYGIQQTEADACLVGEVTTEEECEAAAAQLGNQFHRLPGVYADYPKGCVQKADHQWILWNAVPSGTQKADCKNVCRTGLKDPEEQPNKAADTKPKSYQVGDHVEGQYCNGMWYPATVATVFGNDNFMLDWADGDTLQRNRTLSQIRPRQAAEKEGALLAKSFMTVGITAKMDVEEGANKEADKKQEGYTVVDPVEAQYCNGAWYPAKVATVLGEDEWTIDWDYGDPTQRIMTSSQLRPLVGQA